MPVFGAHPSVLFVFSAVVATVLLALGEALLTAPLSKMVCAIWQALLAPHPELTALLADRVAQAFPVTM